MFKVDFDRTEDGRIEAPTMLVFADADSVMPDHVAELFRLRGGGHSDAGRDGSARPVARLAVVPGRTHSDISRRPASSMLSCPSSRRPRRALGPARPPAPARA